MTPQGLVIICHEELQPAPLDLPRLRAALGRIMDAAARHVTLAGHDLDDTVCRRFAELGLPGESGTTRVECVGLADAGPILEEARRRLAGRPLEPVCLLGAWVSVAVAEGPFTPGPSAGALEDSAPPGLAVHRMLDCPPAATVPGPAWLQAGHSGLLVPAGWRAVLAQPGTIILQPLAPPHAGRG
jgi:hypothetical protein